MSPVTIATDPAGLSYTVDGATFTGAQTFNWTPGSTHTIATASPQAGPAGSRYVFSGWSDGDAPSHTVTAPAAATTSTASFTTQYHLNTAVAPAGSGTVTPGETRRVSLPVRVRDLAYYDAAARAWVVDRLEYPVLVGGSSRSSDLLVERFRVVD